MQIACPNCDQQIEATDPYEKEDEQFKCLQCRVTLILRKDYIWDEDDNEVSFYFFQQIEEAKRLK
jgi:NAD-dependent SIR2 family protein deacetylase